MPYERDSGQLSHCPQCDMSSCGLFAPAGDDERPGCFPVAGKDHVERFGQDLLHVLVLLNGNETKGLGDLRFEVAGELAGVGAGLRSAIAFALRFKEWRRLWGFL